MKEVRYMISDAAKKINVEPHVLRYWEEELGTEIPRNEMGHRYYREEDIRMMEGVKYLKEKGFQLKSIKILLPEMDKAMQLPQRRLLELRDRLELAVNREELRQQREEELKNYPVQGQRSADARADATPLSAADIGKNDIGADVRETPDSEDGQAGGMPAESDGQAGGMPAEAESDGQAGSMPTGTEADGQAGGMSAGAEADGQAGGMPTGTEADGQAGGMPAGAEADRQVEGMAPKKNELQENEPETTPVPVSDNAERMRQFRRIMNEIIMDVMRENNKELTGNITAAVSKEMEYHMRRREMMQEEHFKQLDRTLREYQTGQKQAAVARECGSRRESKFFKKNGKVRI